MIDVPGMLDPCDLSMVSHLNPCDRERLIGGLCDGLETLKTNSPIMYGGRMGDGKIQVYRRGADGHLRYSETIYSTSVTPTVTMPIRVNLN